MLALHNAVRWLVLIAGLWAVVRTWRGFLQGSTWTSSDDKATRFFVIALDVQLLVGLLLYFAFSPLVRQAMGNMAAAMRDAPVRYFVVEHVVIMLVAIVLAHIGSARVKRASTDAAKFRTAAIFYGIAFAGVAGFVPWFRPLMPTF